MFGVLIGLNAAKEAGGIVKVIIVRIVIKLKSNFLIFMHFLL